MPQLKLINRFLSAWKIGGIEHSARISTGALPASPRYHNSTYYLSSLLIESGKNWVGLYLLLGVTPRYISSR